jgi:hypothetical protein
MSDSRIEIDVLKDELASGRIKSEWEESFIESIAEKIENAYTLTEKEFNKLHELYEKYV